MRLEPLLQMEVDLGRRFPIGVVPKGKRTVWTLAGGTVEGPRVRGTVAPVGGEFELIDTQGVCHIDVRLVIVTDDNVNIFVQYFGVAATPPDVAIRLRNGGASSFGDSHFVTQPRFECSDSRYAWLNGVMAIAEGRATSRGVGYRMYNCLPDAAGDDEAFRFRER